MSPPRKKNKKEKSQSGIIRFEVDNDSKLKYLESNGRYSPMVEVGGMPWEANVKNLEGDLKLFLYNMHNQSTPWSMDVNAEFSFINADRSKNITQAKSGCLSNKIITDMILLKADACCEGPTLHLSRMDDEEKKQFLVENKITVEIRFSVSNITGIRGFPLIDFTEASDPFHDIALIIEGEKIYVSKQILAVHSPVFKEMFYGDYKESIKKEIELNGVDREEFLEMLRLIYPSCKKITLDKIESLLELGDRFQIACVSQHAEELLRKSGSDIEQLRLADKFKLNELKWECLFWRRTAKDFEKIKNSPIYDDLSGETKKILFENVINELKKLQ